MITSASPESTAPNSQANVPSPPLTGKTRRIGIHGTRGTGKTCFFGCLYGRRTTETISVLFSDNSSLDYLEKAWAALGKGDLPPATALTLPTELQFAIQNKDRSWDASTRDYAGALVQRSEGGVPELKQEVKDWLKSCHAILLFLNIDADESDILERQNELDLILNELRKLSSTGDKIARPLALLLTKWDTQGEISNDWNQEIQRAKDYLASNLAFQQIANTLKQWGNRVEVFPVSAFGGHRNGNLPPMDGPRPFGLQEPLSWAVEKADEMLLERCRAEVRKAAGPDRCRCRRSYRKAVRIYDELIDDGVKGDVLEEARRERRTWRNKKWVSFIIVSLPIIALIVFGLWWKEYSDYQAAQQALTDPGADLKSQVNAYTVPRWNPWSWEPISNLLGYREEVRVLWTERENQRAAKRHAEDVEWAEKNGSPEKASERMECWEAYLKEFPNSRFKDDVESRLRQDRRGAERKKEEDAFDSLRDFREKNSDLELAEHRVSHDRDFIKIFPNSGQIDRIKNWLAADCAATEKHKRIDCFDQAYNDLQYSLDRAENNKDKTLACIQFLSQFTRAEFVDEKQRKRIDEVDEKRRESVQEQFKQDWDKVDNYAKNNPKYFDEIIDRAKEISRKPDSPYRKEAQSLVNSTEIRWDRAEYEKVRDACKPEAMGDTASIETAAKFADAYLYGTHPLKRAEKDVKKWHQWFKGLKEEKDYFITVKSLSIPADSDLAESIGQEDPRVHVSLDETTLSTKWYKGREPQINEKLGPFHYKGWGHKSKLTVKVEEYDYDSPNDWSEGSTEDERFVLLKANGTFVTNCKKGKDVCVYLECPEVVPPRLPDYPEK